MPTPSILTQIAPPIPPLKSGASNDAPKTKLDSNTPSTFKKMLNGEVNQQQKLKNNIATKNNENKKIEQGKLSNDDSGKINGDNQENLTKATAEAETETDKSVNNNSEEINTLSNDSSQNIINFVANISLLNEQMQGKFAPKEAPLNEGNLDNLNSVQATSLTLSEDQKPAPIPLTDLSDIATSKIGNDKKNSDSIALKDVIDLGEIDKTSDLTETNGELNSAKSEVEKLALEKNSTSQINAKIDGNAPIQKIDFSANKAPPVVIPAITTKDALDAPLNNKLKATSSDKDIKVNDKIDLISVNANDVKGGASKIQFEDHTKHNFNAQLQNLTIESDKKINQDFASIKMDAITAHQLNSAPDQVKASAISNYIPAQLGTKAWDQAMGQRIIWMVAGGEQSAQLSLNPPELGPLQVVLKISDNQVDASFISSHLDVRETIESAMPKLRQMMDDAGIQLSGFSVNSQSAQSGNPFNQEQSQQRVREVASTTELNVQTIDNTPRVSVKKGNGLVDTFV